MFDDDWLFYFISLLAAIILLIGVCLALSLTVYSGYRYLTTPPCTETVTLEIEDV